MVGWYLVFLFPRVGSVFTTSPRSVAACSKLKNVFFLCVFGLFVVLQRVGGRLVPEQVVLYFFLRPEDGMPSSGQNESA